MTDESVIHEFHEILFKWWEDNKRELPWRETENPYHIMVSEFMLQQTQVNRVVPKYLAFLNKFPSINDLAKARQAEVIKLWQGLGYNRRAIWLQEAAQTISKMEKFPTEWNQLLKIRGIGPYAARSIPIFAFNMDYAAIDTNIRRIYVYNGWISENSKPKEIQVFADRAIPKGRSRDYHNALMDYGATHLTSGKTGIAPTSTQTKYKGSKRQIRGKIVALLSDSHTLNEQDLINILRSEIETPKYDFKEIFRDLMKDGLIVKHRNYYQLPQ